MEFTAAVLASLTSLLSPSEYWLVHELYSTGPGSQG